jgi:hypothetical protein
VSRASFRGTKSSRGSPSPHPYGVPAVPFVTFFGQLPRAGGRLQFLTPNGSSIRRRRTILISSDADGPGAVPSCCDLTAASRAGWTDASRPDLADCAPQFAPGWPESGVSDAAGAGVRFQSGLFDGRDGPDGTQKGTHGNRGVWGNSPVATRTYDRILLPPQRPATCPDDVTAPTEGLTATHPSAGRR